MAAASGDASEGALTVPRYGLYCRVIALTASKTASCVIAANRACGNGGCELTVACMIAFQSWTASDLPGDGMHNSARRPQRGFHNCCRIIILTCTFHGFRREAREYRTGRSESSGGNPSRKL